MRKLIREFVQICSDSIPLQDPIYEFGSRQEKGQEELANLRPLFPGKKYIGADLQPGPGVDTILNLHHIALNPGTAGTVLILDTLEHVEYPRKAISEAHRILNTSGILIISSVMNFEIHPNPHDYWRFTPQGFTSLLSQFHKVLVEYIGKQRFPHTILGVAWKKEPDPDTWINLFKKMPPYLKSWFQGW